MGSVILTKQELRALKKLARAHGVSLEEAVRLAIRQAEQKQEGEVSSGRVSAE